MNDINIWISLIIIVSVGVWWVTYRVMVGRMGKICPYGKPCIKFDEMETKAAMGRVVKLLLENMEMKRGMRDDMIVMGNKIDKMECKGCNNNNLGCDKTDCGGVNNKKKK